MALATSSLDTCMGSACSLVGADGLRVWLGALSLKDSEGSTVVNCSVWQCCPQKMRVQLPLLARIIIGWTCGCICYFIYYFSHMPFSALSVSVCLKWTHCHSLTFLYPFIMYGAKVSRSRFHGLALILKYYAVIKFADKEVQPWSFVFLEDLWNNECCEWQMKEWCMDVWEAPLCISIRDCVQ